MARRLALLFWILALVSGRAAAGSATEPPDWAVIGAIFAERCVMCHSEQAAARGLRLDSYEAAVSGGENGIVLIAGDTAKSELLRRLRGESVPRMPFLSRPLPSDQIDLIVRWVEAGLPDAGGR